MSPLDITGSDSISDAMQKTKNLPFGRTDCALPMLHAMEMKMNVDCFIILIIGSTLWVRRNSNGKLRYSWAVDLEAAG